MSCHHILGWGYQIGIWNRDKKHDNSNDNFTKLTNWMMAFVFFNSHFSANITESIDTYTHLDILTDLSVGVAVTEQLLRSNLQIIDSGIR